MTQGVGTGLVTSSMWWYMIERCSKHNKHQRKQ
uniref:Uncharacterized protein n=1 Tax=Arundo donax TaxID=35708 RepID=A0A0A9H8S8_ARUDO